MLRVESSRLVDPLAAEFDALQQLNGWTLIAFDKSGVTLRHLNEFDVTLKLGRGKVESIEFTLLDGQNKTLGTEVSSFFFNSMRQQIDWLHQASPGIRARVRGPGCGGRFPH